MGIAYLELYSFVLHDAKRFEVVIGECQQQILNFMTNTETITKK